MKIKSSVKSGAQEVVINRFKRLGLALAGIR